MKKRTAALYDPYLDILGGGEKHILSILKALEDEGYNINIFWRNDLQSQIENRFHLYFNNKINYLSYLFNTHSSIVTKILKLNKFDLFFYVTDGSYFFSSAKRNFIFCMIPQKNLYKMNLVNKLKTKNFRFISNSQFTRNWLKKYNIESEIIYPYINQDLIDLNEEKMIKDKIILSIGRFYSHLHSKQQSKIVYLYKKIVRKYSQFKDFKLIIAGGLSKKDNDYYLRLKSFINNDPNIILKTNLDYEDIKKLYRKSMFYLHFTGYGTDESKNPEKVEHLGITPLEAMASGCIVYCYNAGGPKELIKDGYNGFTFSNDDELIKKMLIVVNNQNKQKDIRSINKKYIENNFSYSIFRQRVKKIIIGK
ncbi:MAG: glycosyltransferase family 4 protein [Cyanobacteria bacterium]|nr:glycosyltransferase family 4 protein [Cyanobacteriota bacterium]